MDRFLDNPIKRKYETSTATGELIEIRFPDNI